MSKDRADSSDAKPEPPETPEPREAPAAQEKYEELPDTAVSDYDDSTLDYDNLNDPTEQGNEAVRDQDAVTAARAEVEQAYAAVDARQGVDDAHNAAAEAGAPVNNAENFEKQAQEHIDNAPPATGAKEVEFKELDPAKQVEFKEPAPQRESDYLPDPAESVREKSVIDNAKTDLAARQEAGEQLGGDPIGRADQWHWQGQNESGLEGTCGIASSGDVLRDCGQDVSEDDLVHEMHESDPARWTVDTQDPDWDGATTYRDRDELLNGRGVESEVVKPKDSEELASYVENGNGVITRVNSDLLWSEGENRSQTDQMESYGQDVFSDRPDPDHAVVVTGTVRDSGGDLKGFVINDHGDPEGAGRVVDIDQWHHCWADINGGHETNVTVRAAAAERNNAG